MDLELAQRTAVITGASSGIGRGIARCLAAEGVVMAIVARRRERLDELADELEAGGARRPFVITGDMTVEADQEELIRRAIDQLGCIEILINSAGGHYPSRLGATDDQYAQAMLMNFEAQRRLISRIWGGMGERGWGRIISITGKSEPEFASGVLAAKAALHVWSKGLSRELAPLGITVNSVAPGRIMTDQMARDYTPQEREEHVRQIPVGRYGTVEEIGRLAAFLASPHASYITGTVIPVDGGLRRFQF